ncbi:hypothetical protein, partial [Neisseria meningitidis]|uniref:hypothetical protein n=1 Tax=Neisseria meningitidis TaxID=487 RepID=UPI001E3F65DF
RKRLKPKRPDSRLRGNDKLISYLKLKKQKPLRVIPTKVGIRELNVTVIYRKRLKPNELDSRLRGNDDLLVT